MSVESLTLSPQLNVHTMPVDPTVEGGAQLQQILNIECLSDFSDTPVLNVQFRLVSESNFSFSCIRFLCVLIPDSVCEQIRGNSSEHRSETPCDAQQVFPAHGDDIRRLLPALEAARSVRLALHHQCTTAPCFHSIGL